MRDAARKMEEKHFSDRTTEHVEFLPVEWRSKLALDGGMLDLNKSRLYTGDLQNCCVLFCYIIPNVSNNIQTVKIQSVSTVMVRTSGRADETALFSVFTCFNCFGEEDNSL